MLKTFKAVPMHTLFLQGADYTLHHAVLLRAVRCDELLLQAIAPDQSRVSPAGEHQTVVRAQQARLPYATQCPIPADQRLLQRRLRGSGLPATRQMLAQQLSGMAVARLPEWIEDYNRSHPHKGLKMKSPWEYRAELASNE